MRATVLEQQQQKQKKKTHIPRFLGKKNNLQLAIHPLGTFLNWKYRSQ